MRVVVVIQARMGSTRLPGKVLQDLGGMPVLEWVVRACRQAALADEVVVATSGLAQDDPVAALAAELGVGVVRGSEEDVLARYLQALDEHPCDAVVRITADCPFTDPALIDAVVAAWRADPAYDYVSTVVARTLPHGLDVELVRAEALRRVERTATAHHRVHVTSGIYTAPESYDLLGLVFAPDSTDLRVTLDTPEDLTALRAVVDVLGSGVASRRQLIALLRERPDLVALNASVGQKSLEAG
jgi:spore coat polysaccharide biosynthesis protein SpsF